MAFIGWTALSLLAFCIVAETTTQVSFKAAAVKAHERESLLNAPYALALARQPLLWLGLTLWAVEVAAWVATLHATPLSIAYPIMTLTYAGVPIASFLFLRERLTRAQIIGAAMVTVGVACVGLAPR